MVIFRAGRIAARRGKALPQAALRRPLLPPLHTESSIQLAEGTTESPVQVCAMTSRGRRNGTTAAIVLQQCRRRHIRVSACHSHAEHATAGGIVSRATSAQCTATAALQSASACLLLIGRGVQLRRFLRLRPRWDLRARLHRHAHCLFKLLLRQRARPVFRQAEHAVEDLGVTLHSMG